MYFSSDFLSAAKTVPSMKRESSSKKVLSQSVDVENMPNCFSSFMGGGSLPFDIQVYVCSCVYVLSKDFTYPSSTILFFRATFLVMTEPIERTYLVYLKASLR